MGYHIHLKNGSQFRIPAANQDVALAAMKAMFDGGRKYSWVDKEDVIGADTLVQALEPWGHAMYRDKITGDLDDLEYLNEKAGGERALYETLAPFVLPGSHLDFYGEDGDHWRWVFDGKTVKHLKGVVSYVEP